MKPTEADIQAELIEGWEITEKSPAWTFEEGGYFQIDSDSSLRVVLFPRDNKTIDFLYTKVSRIEIDFTDFLTGNYDLSAISQHYDPEEWQRIITMCESIVCLITGEQVEQTLEEAVKALLPDCAELIDADCDPIEIRCGEYHIKLSSELIWWREVYDFEKTPWTMVPLDKFNELIHKDLYDKLPRIAAEISKHQSKRSTKPSYSDLEQRVEELEKLVDEEHRKAKEFHRDSITKSDRITELERENASLLDKFGPIDQAEQQAAEAQKEFETFTEKVGRWAHGIIQLNEEIL